jgi:YycE-like C-terminal domain/YycE-like N-terminal domain
VRPVLVDVLLVFGRDDDCVTPVTSVRSSDASTRPEPHRVVTMSNRPGRAGRWPEHLPVGAFRVGRSSVRYDETVRFYRDLVGLPVLEIFEDSYGEDGVIFGLPDTSVQLEIVRSSEPVVRVDRVDSLVFYLPGAAAQQRLVARMAAAGAQPTTPHPYWHANGGVTYQDPDGREVVFVSWVYGRDRT